MKRSIAIAAVLSLLAIPLWAADAEKARKRLEREDHPFTVEEFLKMVFLGEDKVVQLFLDAGMSPDAADEKGVSALHQAAWRDDERTVSVLLKAKAKVDARDQSGNTPLCNAAGRGLSKNVDLLIRAGADVNAVCSFSKTPLHNAAGESDAASVALLLAAKASVDTRDSHNETPLVIAAHEGSLPVVNALLKAGADVNARGNSGNTPLFEGVDADQPDVVKALLDAGADPNVRNRAGRTPLYEAARFGRPKSVPLLLAAGADPGMKVDGMTPLSAAREEKRSDIIGMLEGAKSVAAKPAARPQPAAAPVSGGADAAAQLKKMGITTIDADTLLARVEARDVRAVTLLLAAGVKPNVRDDAGRPPLWNAIESQDAPMVKALLAAGASPNDSGKASRKEFESGQTLVMLAADHDDASILAALIAAGAEVDKPNMYGVNAIMSAAMQGKAEMVKALIDGKANVNAVDSAGTPVLYSAVQSGNVDVLRMLLDAGALVGPHKKLLIDRATENKNAQMKQILEQAAASPADKAASAKAPKQKKPPNTAPSWESFNFPKPIALSFGKSPVTAKQVYDAVLPIARKWQSDAELVDLGTLSTGLLDANGRSAHWNINFCSRSAQKVNAMQLNDGSLIPSPQPSNELREIGVDETTIFDTKRLNEIADAAGATKWTSKGVRPMAGLIYNPVTGPAWYFNYSDPETQRNVMTVIINASTGKVVLTDPK